MRSYSKAISTTCYPLAVSLLLSTICWVNAYSATKPDWLLHRPESGDFYIGIGYAEKVALHKDAYSVARENALSDLASEISIFVTSTSLVTLSEQSGLSETSLKQEIHSSTRADLEGYEEVGTWNDETTVWVYYRLSKTRFTELHRSHVRRAISLALGFLESSESELRRDNPVTALSYDLHALYSLQRFSADSLDVDFYGKRVNLWNEAYTSLQTILSCISFTSRANTITGRLGMGCEQPINITVTCRLPNDIRKPLLKLPITFRFVAGKGLLSYSKVTDENGMSTCNIVKIVSRNGAQQIIAEIDWNSILPLDSMDTFTKCALSHLQSPHVIVSLTVEPLRLVVANSATSSWKSNQEKIIVSEIKRNIASLGCVFVDSVSLSDYLLQIETSFRQGNRVYGIDVVFVDATISIVDTQTRNEIYRCQLLNNKGLDSDREKATVKAYEKAARFCSEKLLAWFESFLCEG